MTPAIVPITIPAIAPGLKPWLLVAAIGSVLPLAVAGGIKGCVVVAEIVPVAVMVAPLVGRTGAEYELVPTYVQLEVRTTQDPEEAHI